MQKIFSGNNLLAILHRSDNWKSGLDFITQDSDFIQVGTWFYENDKSLDRHYHNTAERITSKTCECIFIVSGKLQTSVYSPSKELVETIDLEEGDLMVFLDGGHSYITKSDNTKVLEVKNGPFLGVDIDKTRF
jgi:hypothetical protein